MPDLAPDVFQTLLICAALAILIAGPLDAAGQALTVEHPVMDHGIDPNRGPQYEAAVSDLMAMSVEETLAFIPDKPYVSYCECPNCFGGVEGNMIFTWDLARPEQLTCKFCGTVFPNERFPEDQTLEGKNALGETVQYRYHLSEGEGVRHFISANLSRYRVNWLTGKLVGLARAYQATQNEKYARRVALIVDRVAQVYPHYPVIQDLPRRVNFRESQQPPWPWDSGKWGHFHNEVPKPVVAAYDMTCESAEYDKLSAQRGYDVRQTLEDDVFREVFHAISLQTHHMSNVIGYDVAGAAAMGRVMNEPRMVHWAFRWMAKVVNDGCFVDGMWHESASYHYMTMGGLRNAFAQVRGYSDPPGYVDEVDGKRFDDLDPEQALPFYAKALKAPEVVGFPNGWSSPFHDTHPYERRTAARDVTTSSILPGYGHASLGRGAGPNQMQAQLHFSGGYGHTHLDNLSLILWAKGREMLPDLGYTWTQMRYWCSCTLGHNTVVVNRSDQQSSRSDGDLLWYFPDVEGVSVVEADGRRAYQSVDGLDLYRRMLVSVPVSDADAYVVDIFRVRGGNVHDWTLNGDADVDTNATCSLPLTGNRETMLEPGEAWKEPKIEGDRSNPYGFVRDVQHATADGPFTVSFAYDEAPDTGLRLHVSPSGPCDVFLGRSPSVRRAGQGSRADMRRAHDFWMPKLIVRRTGDTPVQSVFAAVEEPYSGAPFIDRVQWLSLEPSDENAVALRVTHGDVVDTLISTLDEAPYPERVTEGGVCLQGRLAVVRQRAEQIIGVWLFDGTRVSGDGWALEAEGDALAGTLTGATRIADGAELDSLITDAPLPTGTVLRGKWMIVRHDAGYTHGCEIDRVEEAEGQRVIVTKGDHGLRIDQEATTEVYFPQRRFGPRSTFRIPAVTCLTTAG